MDKKGNSIEMNTLSSSRVPLAAVSPPQPSSPPCPLSVLVVMCRGLMGSSTPLKRIRTTPQEEESIQDSPLRQSCLFCGTEWVQGAVGWHNIQGLFSRHHGIWRWRCAFSGASSSHPDSKGVSLRENSDVIPGDNYWFHRVPEGRGGCLYVLSSPHQTHMVLVSS